MHTVELSSARQTPDVGTILSGRRAYHGGRPFVTDQPSVSTRRGQVDIAREGKPLLLIDGDKAIARWQGEEFCTSVTQQPRYLGGHQNFLTCPDCGKPRVTLYIMHGKLLCQPCAGLRYPSQVMNRRQRQVVRADRIRRRLGWPSGVLRPWGARPTRMRWQTFYRLANELAEIEAVLLPDLGEWARKASERLR
jgi:hypothetical protein